MSKPIKLSEEDLERLAELIIEKLPKQQPVLVPFPQYWIPVPTVPAPAPYRGWEWWCTTITTSGDTNRYITVNGQ